MELTIKQVQPLPMEYKENATLKNKLTTIKKFHNELFSGLDQKEHIYRINETSAISLTQGGADFIRTALGLRSETIHSETTERTDNGLLIIHTTEAYCNVYHNDILVGSEYGRASTNESGVNTRDEGMAIYQTTLKARKRAYVRAILQASGLRGKLTQDLENMDPEYLKGLQIGTEAPKKLSKESNIKINNTYRTLRGIIDMSGKHKKELRELAVKWGQEVDKDITSTQDILEDDQKAFRLWLQNQGEQ